MPPRPWRKNQGFRKGLPWRTLGTLGSGGEELREGRDITGHRRRYRRPLGWQDGQVPGNRHPRGRRALLPGSTGKESPACPGKTVILQKGLRDVDQYGRILRCVCADGYFVNAELVAEGYASAYIFDLDDWYSPPCSFSWNNMPRCAKSACGRNDLLSGIPRPRPHFFLAFNHVTPLFVPADVFISGF